MNRFIRQCSQGYFTVYYLIPFLGIWLAGLLFVLAEGYTGSFLILNGLHTPWLDDPMLVLTQLGDGGILAVLLILLLLRKQPYQLAMLLLTLIVSGLLAQLLKNSVFSQWDRPPSVFKEEIHTVARYVLYRHSFPSGHSATVAAVFSMLAFFRRQHKAEVIAYALLCSMTAYTRIYLGVHFAGDVVAGLLLGLITTLLLLLFIPPFNLRLKPGLVHILRIAALIAAILLLMGFCKEYL